MKETDWSVKGNAEVRRIVDLYSALDTTLKKSHVSGTKTTSWGIIYPSASYRPATPLSIRQWLAGKKSRDRTDPADSVDMPQFPSL